MSLMFAAVTLLTGINLLFIPFQPVPALLARFPTKPHVIHSYPPVLCFLPVPVFTTGDFPDGNRGCHASHRACCAVPARPLRGSGFPSQAVATSTAGLLRPFRSRRPFYAPYPALSAPRQTDAGL
ncbi:hypothetical protein RL87_005382 [Salmonella enterica subsp. enterica]|nr:hypothetical protein [Salmonella enterica subsp. enterica serovar Glostrup]